MKSTYFFTCHAKLAAIALLCSLAGSNASGQTNPAPLNLDDSKITRELVKNEPVGDKTETVSTEPKKMDESFRKAEKPSIIVPKTEEIPVSGSAQRVTKVTGPDGSYCVYTPTVARTDGIDEIQNGLQNQVRTCPK